MPHVRRRMLVRLAAPLSDVRGAIERALDVEPRSDGSFVGPLFGDSHPQAHLHVEAADGGEATNVTLEARSDLRLPYFGGFLRAMSWFASRGALRHAAARVRAALTDEVPARAPRRAAFVPPAAFTADQASRLAVLCAIGAIANFGSVLFTQNGDAATTAFGRSGRAS